MFSAFKAERPRLVALTLSYFPLGRCSGLAALTGKPVVLAEQAVQRTSLAAVELDRTLETGEIDEQVGIVLRLVSRDCHVHSVEVSTRGLGARLARTIDSACDVSIFVCRNDLSLTHVFSPNRLVT
jgi:hypothetical protein